MTAIFELLFKYRPLLYERGTIAFDPYWPPYVTWILLAGALAGAWFIYRASAAALPWSWRYGLSSLRAAAFLVIILILLQPVLRIHSVLPQESFVAVAYDASKSMEIRDGPEGQSRLDVERHLLRSADNPWLDELGKKFKLRFFRFSHSAERVQAFEDTARHGQVTDLERTLDQISGELANVPAAGIVLITDGADNRSSDLDRTASRLRARNTPIYTVGIGSTSFLHDTEITGVTTARKVLRDTVMEAEVSVRSNGYAGRRARLLVLDRNRLLQNQEITLGSDGEVKVYRTHFSSQTGGPREFKFRVDPFQDEIIKENNDRTVLVEVDDAHPEILYVEGEPRWEYAFLRRAAVQDRNVRLVTLLRQADGKFLRQGIESPATLEKGFPTDRAELFKYKAILLGSVEASFFTFDQLRIISDFVSRRGGGFLMIGGRNSFGQGGYVNTPIQDMLPVNLGAGARDTQGFEDTEFKVRLTDYGYQHPITRISLAEDQNRKRWTDAPALVGFNRVAGPKPGATVLAMADSRAAGGADPVLLAFQRFGRGKSVAFTTASSWRWKMGNVHSDNFQELFWKQMLRWLVSDVPDPVGTGTEESYYAPDETAVIRAEVNDESFLPLNNAQVTAQVKSPSGRSTPLHFSWDVEKDGSYVAAFKPEEEGIYEITSEAFQGSRSLGRAKSNFLVAGSTKEFHNASMNSALLKRLASESGGRYYTPDNAGTIAEDISYIDKGSSSHLEEKELWDMPFLFLLLVGLISAEWILRKRRGLA